MRAYFDHNASSPLNSDVLQKMMPFLQTVHANPSSLHQSGRVARSAIETARLQIAKAVNCQPQQIVFTSGGTESNNMVLQAFNNNAVNVGSIEHASVLEVVKNFVSVNLIDVDELGIYKVEKQDVNSGFISLQLVNNETGVIQPIDKLRNHMPKALIHSDASQALGKISIDFKSLDIDFMTLSAHKFNGPKGIGALIIKEPESFNALMLGGPQEKGYRAGTENVAAIVGMGLAAEIASETVTQRSAHFKSLRDYFEQKLSEIDGVSIFAKNSYRVSNTSFFALPFFHGETFLMECDQAGFELASGSACHSSVTEPSHVLKAMNIDDDIALNAVRASFGVDNTRQQIDEFIQFIHDKLENLPASIKSAAGFR